MARPVHVCAVTQSGGELRVGDHQGSPGVDDRLGVELLLAVADRQRHEDRGDADRGRLGDAVGAGPADHQVGRGQRVVHPVDVADQDVVGTPSSGTHVVLGADDVQHLDAGLAERRGGRGDRGR